MKFPFYIAKRYLFSKSSNTTINIITRIASVGIMVGTLALFIVLSGFSGLRTFSLSFLNISDPDVKIMPAKGKSFEFTEDLNELLNTNSNIASFSKVLQEKAFFSFEDKKHVAYIKGVDANYSKVNDMDTTVYIGTWLDPKIPMGSVVGNGVSDILSVGVFEFIEQLKVYVPKPGKGYINNPNNAFRSIETQPIGVFLLAEDIDKNFVFVTLEVAQMLLDYKTTQISAIEMKLTEDTDIDIFIDELQATLGTGFDVKSRQQLNAAVYKMLNSENFIAYLISTLIVIIAFFNVIGALMMMILDKRDNLKTLISMGATIKDIKRIFILQGFLLSVIGLVIGLGLGIILIALQLQFDLFMITPHIAYPVELTLGNIVLVFFTILILGYGAAQIASFKINPKFIDN